MEERAAVAWEAAREGLKTFSIILLFCCIQISGVEKPLNLSVAIRKTDFNQEITKLLPGIHLPCYQS